MAGCSSVDEWLRPLILGALKKKYMNNQIGPAVKQVWNVAMDELNNDTSLQQKGSPRHSGKPPLPLVQKQSDVVMDSLLKAG